MSVCRVPMQSRRCRASPVRSAAAVGAAAVVLLAGAGEAAAHGAPLDRRVDWYDWNGDPVAWLCLVLAAGLYARGLLAIRQRGSSRRIVPSRRAAAFAAGLGCLALAVISPIDPLGEQLAWVHMVQHMILMTIAAPLMVIGAPLPVCLWGMPAEQRRVYARLRRSLDRRRFPWRLWWNPLLIWTLHAAVIWTWHLPVLYQAALRSPVVHDLQHLMFFSAAWLFWRVLLDPLSRFRLEGGVAVIYLFTTTLHATLLGVFMTIAPAAWYDDYQGRTELWGLTPLEDQQLAGLVMWMPACAAYLLAALVLLARTIREHPAEPLQPVLQTTGGR